MPSERHLILKNIRKPGYSTDIECYLRHGGYQALRKALALQPVAQPDGTAIGPKEQIRREVEISGLRGRGGAGFSCGMKWSLVDRKSGKPIYLVCNADESEPGTFKDRQIIHRDPHQLIEGMIIACYANDVHLAFIYIRGEFIEGARILERALEEARAAGFLGRNILGTGYDLDIYIHRGAGAYICGEETGLIESLEGKRPYPRIKPPYFPAVLGLYQCPTIVNNVETLCAVKHIVDMGGAEYARLGTPDNTGTRLVCISGHVKRPGCYEIEVGKVTFRDLIFDEAFGGGLHDARQLKAIIPGGVSAKVFRAGEKVRVTKRAADGKMFETEMDVLDLPYDFTSVSAAGSMSGSGAIIVLDDSADMVEVLANISEFFAHESCGQCTPCREGSLWMAKILRRLAKGNGQPADLALLLSVADQIPGGRTICAFGEACSWPVQSLLVKFGDEFRAKVQATADKRPDRAFAEVQ
ncbi:MAG: NADH-quinone oxidoreductase subunit NuoF [Verrucomicrobiota bacterium]|nr:NADH-quinone oxidoreductase subunit NuoF [Verrucomicrobiota bacterium]